MDYWLQHVFTGREYAKLVSSVTRKHSSEPISPPDHVKQIRSLVRLFGKAWLTSYIVGKVLRRSTNPTKISSTLVACTLSYRLVFKYLTRSEHLKSCNSLRRLSKYAAPISGAIAGYILALGLPSSFALVASIYLASKVCEWSYDIGDDDHKFDWKPELLGAWTLFPLAFSQLFQHLMLSPATCPSGFQRLMVALSNGSLVLSPQTDDVAVEIAHSSVSYFPRSNNSLVYQSELSAGSVILSSLPRNNLMVESLLNPQVGGWLQYFVNTAGSNLTLVSKYLLPIYLLRAYLGSKSYEKAIVQTFRVAVTYSLSAASALAGISLSQRLLGRKLSPQARFRLVGFLSGLWAIVNQKQGRAQFLYAARLAVLSLIPTALHPKVPSVLMPISMACAFAILNARPEGITQRFWKKLGYWVQTNAWVESPESESLEDRP